MEQRRVHWTASVGPDGIAIAVKDETSGQDIIRIRLDVQQVFDVITGLTSPGNSANAWVITKDEAAHLGKKLHVFRRRFGHADPAETAAVRRAVRRGEIPEEWTAWGDALQAKTWSHRTRWGLHNDGVSFIMFRYDNDLTAEQADAVADVVRTTTPPEGLKDR